MKYLIGILVALAAMFMGAGLPAFMDSITDFRTDTVTDDYVIATNTTSTNGTIQLTKQLWDASLVNASITSNNVLDTPAMVTFVAGNKSLFFNGLAVNTTRLISVEYKTAGLTGYTGAETGVKMSPVLMIVAIIVLPLLSIVMIALGRRG
jgi:hypothetical protein